MFRFANPEYLYLLLALPMLIGLYYWSSLIRKRAIQRFGDYKVLKELMPEASSKRPILKAILLCVIFVSLVMAISRPQLGSKLKEVKRKGVELVIALDVSNSMLARDITPSRLERAKQAITRLVDRLSEDRIGLIVFAGDAYVQLPVTSDYVSAKMFLGTINPGMVPTQGTSIGKAIDLATNSFSQQSGKNRTLIVITDGENHDDDPLVSAKRAADEGIVIHTIGIGNPQGAPIPINSNGGFLTDADGQIVMSKLDENILKSIASTTGGMYVLANNSNFGLNEVLDQIRKMDKQEFTSKVYSDYDEKFPYFLWFALFLLIVEYFVLERKNRWQEKFEIFKSRLK